MFLIGSESLNFFFKNRCVCKKWKMHFHINESKDVKILRAVNITLKAAGREDDIVTNLIPAFLLIRR